ncbi:Transcription factor Pcc1 [Nakaseomyces glabratus]
MSKNNTRDLSHTLDLHVPFETARDALIAQRVLQPDPILRPEDFQVEYEAKATVLDIHFKAIDDRVLRVGVSSVIDSIKSIVETIDELDPETIGIDYAYQGSMSIFHLLGTDDSEVVSKLRYIGQGRRGLKSSSYKVYHKMLLCTIRYTDHI